MIERFDFSQYHGLDHWPFSPRCHNMPTGGGLYHLRLAWQQRRRGQAWRWFYLWRCRHFDKHVDVLYSVGHNPGKECWYCKRLTSLTAADREQLKRNWPRSLRLPGGDDEVALETPEN